MCVKRFMLTASSDIRLSVSEYFISAKDVQARHMGSSTVLRALGQLPWFMKETRFTATMAELKIKTTVIMEWRLRSEPILPCLSMCINSHCPMRAIKPEMFGFVYK